MNDASLLTCYHALFRQVRDRLSQLKPKEEVRVFVYPCAGPELGTARGFLMHGEERPTGKIDPAQSAPVSDDEQLALTKLSPVSVLHVGEYVHIGLESRRSGFLHLFNFGTGGKPKRLIPNTSDAPLTELPADRLVFVTPNHGSSPHLPLRQTFRELGDRQGTRLGKANNFPEGILALITSGQIRIEAGDLHSDWRTSYRGGSAWDQGEVLAGADAGLSRLLKSVDWDWGYLEVPVVEQA